MSKTITLITNDQGPSFLWNKLGGKIICTFTSLHDNLVENETGQIFRKGQATWWATLPNETEEEIAIVEEVRQDVHFGGKFTKGMVFSSNKFYETDVVPDASLISNLRGLKDPNSPITQSNIDTAVNSALANEKKNAEEAVVKLNEEKAQIIADNKRWAELSTQVQKLGGGIAANAPAELIEEFKILTKKLGYQDEEITD